jgi:hypothetical protein
MFAFYCDAFLGARFRVDFLLCILVKTRLCNNPLFGRILVYLLFHVLSEDRGALR